MDIRSLPSKTHLLLSLLALSLFSSAQNCDTTLINAHLNPAGYNRLYVQNEPCSMYFYSTALQYGINAHRQAANLGVPMLVINDSAENTNVGNALYSQGVFNASPDVWLGITDSGSTYNWRTFDGSPAPSFFNWTSGEPNNLSPSCKVGTVCIACFGADAYYCANGEDCAVMNASYKWLDNTCEGTNVTRATVLELNVCPVVLSGPIDTTICAGMAINASTKDTGGTSPYTYTWGGAVTGSTVHLTPDSTTTYVIEASDKYHCKTDTAFTITVNKNVPVANAGAAIMICPGATDTLGAAADSDYTYLWSPVWGLSSDTTANPTISIASNPRTTAIDTTYILTATWGLCSTKDTVQVTVYPNINNNFNANAIDCGSGNFAVTYAGVASGTATYTWSFDSATIVSGSGAGGYELTWPTLGAKTLSLTVTDHGCVGTPVSKTVTVYPKPSAVITASGLALSSTAYAHYQWLESGAPLAGDTAQTFTANANGNYQVLITDSNGCTDTSAIYTVTGVGISAISSGRMIRIYPSPNTGSFIVETHNAIGAEITITDITGKVMMKQVVTVDKQAITMQAAEAGTYFVTVKAQAGDYTGRVIITKE